MSRYAARLFTVIALACLVLVACKKQPPKAPEPEPEEPMAEKDEPPPPPPPKCESIDEKCVGKADKLVEIGEHGSFQPPVGWHYAKVEQGSFALATEEDAGIAFAHADGTEADKVFAALSPMLEHLGVTDVTADSVKKMMKKKPVVEEANGLKLNTWDTACKVKGDAGMMLLAVAPGDGGALVGVVAMKKDAAKDRGAPARDSLLSVRSGK